MKDLYNPEAIGMAQITVAETTEILVDDLANLEIIRDNWYQVVQRSKKFYDEALAGYLIEKNADFQAKYEAAFNVFKLKEEQFSAVVDRCQKIKDMIKLLNATEKALELKAPKGIKGN